MIGQITKYGSRLGIDGSARVSGQRCAGNQLSQYDIEVIGGFGVLVVEAKNTVESVTAPQQLELLGKLVVLVDHRRIEVGNWQAVEIND